MQVIVGHVSALEASHVELGEYHEHTSGGYLDYKENITNKQAAFRLHISL